MLWTHCFNTSISFSKNAGCRLALSLYVFLHNASTGPRGGGGGPGGHVPPPPTHKQDVRVSLKKYIYILRIICTAMV